MELIDEEIVKIKLTNEISDKVESELKKRFTWLGVLYGVIVGALITLTVQVTLDNVTADLKVDAALQKKITQKAYSISETIEEAQVHINKSREEINSLQSQTKSIIKALGNNSVKASNLAESNSNEIEQIQQILKEMSNDDLKSVNKINELGKAISITQNKITEAKDFVNLTNFPVTISNFDKSENLKNRVEEIGFVAKFTPEKSVKSKSIGIRLATELPAAYAKQIIEISIRELPIQYIYMGDFEGNVNSIFIGKYSTRQKENNPPMDQKFINSLLSINDNMLYSKIRSYYK